VSQQVRKYAFRIFQNVDVRIADNAIALTRQPLIANRIFEVVIVLATVRFDDDPRLQANEVRDVRAHRRLTPKLHTIKAAITQKKP
jgi:hypothetical protein